MDFMDWVEKEVGDKYRGVGSGGGDGDDDDDCEEDEDEILAERGGVLSGMEHFDTLEGELMQKRHRSSGQDVFHICDERMHNVPTISERVIMEIDVVDRDALKKLESGIGTFLNAEYNSCLVLQGGAYLRFRQRVLRMFQAKRGKKKKGCEDQGAAAESCVDFLFFHVVHLDKNLVLRPKGVGMMVQLVECPQNVQVFGARKKTPSVVPKGSHAENQSGTTTTNADAPGPNTLHASGSLPTVS